MIAIIPNTDGRLAVVLDGRWKGWLVRYTPNGWVTDTQLPTIDPYAGNPFAAIFGGPIKETPNEKDTLDLLF